MNKELLVDAIYGSGFASIDQADAMTKVGLAEFCGNQWNEDWQWLKDKLIELDEAELTEIYKMSKRR